MPSKYETNIKLLSDKIIDSLYNFMGACANNNGADVYGCPDNSCCNY